jgi:hypothetical protein
MRLSTVTYIDQKCHEQTPETLGKQEGNATAEHLQTLRPAELVCPQQRFGVNA